MSKPEFVYTIYIASTPEKVFAALTDAEANHAGDRSIAADDPQELEERQLTKLRVQPADRARHRRL
jgi:hypothetical protein